MLNLKFVLIGSSLVILPSNNRVLSKIDVESGGKFGGTAIKILLSKVKREFILLSTSSIDPAFDTAMDVSGFCALL